MTLKNNFLRPLIKLEYMLIKHNVRWIGLTLLLYGCSDNASESVVPQNSASQPPTQQITCEESMQSHSSEVDISVCLEQARQGNAQAQYIVAKNYQLGIGVQKDEAQARAWLQHAAQNNYPQAQLELARMYHYGLMGLNDAELAFRWYLQGAKNNDPECHYQVGRSLYYGELGQDVEPERGIKYLTQAAQLNYYPAQYAVASLSLEGKLTLDKTQTMNYLRQAANAGLAEAQYKLAKVLMQFSLPQYDKAAFFWVNKAAEQQHLEAKYLLANFYFEGIGTEVNYDKAFVLFTELHQAEHHLAHMKLGQMYYHGQGVAQDQATAKQLLLLAAQNGVPEAKNWIMILFKESMTGDSENTDNSPEEVTWLNFAADNGDPEALAMKGKCMLYGTQGFHQNVQQGLQTLQTAAEQNSVLAQRELGVVYEQGLFDLTDADKAFQWYQRASENGDRFAQYRLAQMIYFSVGKQRNVIESYAWANLAASEGDSEATALRDEIATHLESEALLQAKDLARQYGEKYASQIGN